MPELLVDQDCERALASEAVRNYAKFTARGVSLDDFGSPAARLVVEVCADLWEAGQQVDHVSVATKMQRDGTKGASRQLAELLAVDAVPDHERVRSLASLRRLMSAGHELVAAAKSGDLPAAVDAIQRAERTALGGREKKVKNGSEVVQALFDSVKDQAKAESRRVHPGLPAVFDAVGYLPLGSCTVIGADTNVGKSSFVLEMMIACAERNVTAGLISVEDPEDVTGSRLLAAYSGVSSRNMQRGKFREEDMPSLADGVSKVKKLGDRFLFADCTGETELDVCAAMTQMANRGAKLVVVDYLTEIEASKSQQDRRNEIRWICKRLKSHAKRLNIALVVVSQLSRPQDKQTGKRPSKHDLKESGDVSNSAEVILMLWRETEGDKAPVKIWVAKCKWGGVGQWWEMKRQDGSGRLAETTGVYESLPQEKAGKRGY